MSYEVVVQGAALTYLLGCSASDQQSAAEMLARLAADPFQVGRQQEKDSAGRTLEVVSTGRFVVTFWSDHSIRELRVVGIHPIRRRCILPPLAPPHAARYGPRMLPVAEAPGGPGVAVVEASPFPAVPQPPEHFLAAFRWMLLARVLDEKLAGLYRAGKIQGGVYLGTGQEALSASLGVHLRRGDVFAPLIRDLAGRLAFGEDPLDVTRTYLGSPLGPMRGRDGNIHRGRPREGMLAMISHLGAMIPVVNGVLLARRLRGELAGVVGATCLGDGGTSTGAFHEGLNQAAVEKLPLVLVVANNQYAYSTPTTRQFACADLLDRAAGYGVDGHAADGTDLGSCLLALGNAVARARAGRGPQLVVAKLLRLTGHGVHDDAAYVDPALRASALGGDCLKLATEQLVDQGWAERDEIEAWRAEAVSQVETAVVRTQREPAPDPAQEDWCALASRHLG